jgi:hypothetical protein
VPFFRLISWMKIPEARALLFRLISGLSSSTVLYIPFDDGGDYFSTFRMCSASCTSGLYLRVWGWVGRYAGGGLVRVVRLFFRPGRPQKRLGKAQTPTRLAD